MKKGLERYRVRVVEKVNNSNYVVMKHNYQVSGIFYLTTKQKLLSLGDIVYVIVMPDGYRCKLFSECMEEK